LAGGRYGRLGGGTVGWGGAVGWGGCSWLGGWLGSGAVGLAWGLAGGAVWLASWGRHGGGRFGTRIVGLWTHGHAPPSRLFPQGEGCVRVGPPPTPALPDSQRAPQQTQPPPAARRPNATPPLNGKQTGFGRTGDAYWGFQLQGVQPDIVTMAKGIGNGLPMGAVVTTPAVAEALTRRIHFNTWARGLGLGVWVGVLVGCAWLQPNRPRRRKKRPPHLAQKRNRPENQNRPHARFGGNPVCSAGGRAVLRVIDREGIQQHCADVGSHLLGRLRALQVRGGGKEEEATPPMTERPSDWAYVPSGWRSPRPFPSALTDNPAPPPKLPTPPLTRTRPPSIF
jgi:hypothetical protein